jgi:hypothetical protein
MRRLHPRPERLCLRVRWAPEGALVRGATLAGQTHDVSSDATAPVLEDFLTS